MGLDDYRRRPGFIDGRDIAGDFAYLEAQGAAKPSSIAAGIHKSFSSVWNALLRLQDRGKAVRTRDKRWELSSR
jgi:hypothetical protein